MIRPDARENGQLRPVCFERHYVKDVEGAVLSVFGDTKVLCTATVEESVPPFLANTGVGWVTAEYAMLPRSASQRINRGAYQKGRAKEISRLIGRALRNVVDREVLGPRQIVIDCDVIQADGGTRTAAITGAYIALHDALTGLVERGRLQTLPLIGHCAAISVGLVEGEALLDLCYEEDVRADVDMNVVMRDDGGLIEVQGAAEGDAFQRHELDALLDLAVKGVTELFAHQKEALGID